MQIRVYCRHALPYVEEVSKLMSRDNIPVYYYRVWTLCPALYSDELCGRSTPINEKSRDFAFHITRFGKQTENHDEIEKLNRGDW